MILDQVSDNRERAAALESQAIGRAYRQGQKKHVTVVRIVLRGTIEEEQFKRAVLPKLYFSLKCDLHQRVLRASLTTTAPQHEPCF